MDFYKILFWAGFIILTAAHLAIVRILPSYGLVMLTASLMMFVGSKLGREFLGLAI